jgi:murein DD-endopeptidase MepM/ murein hydrolase activator NlpD
MQSINGQSERGAGARSTRALGQKRRRARHNRIVGALAVVVVVVTGTFAGGSAFAAQTDDYPSWADVQAARSNTAAKQAEITKIQALIVQQQAAVVEAQDRAAKAGFEAQTAQYAFDDAKMAADKDQAAADSARARANKSKLQAGQLAARLARAGGAGDLSTTIFFSGDKASNLLSQLGMDSLVKNQAAGLYAKATQDAKTAQSLTDQAGVARDALKALSDAAKSAFDRSVALSTQASALLDQQQATLPTLNAQLAVVQTNSDATTAEYSVGQAIKAAAAKAAAAKAAQAALAAGAITNSGWARPAGGHITQTYGYHVTHVDGSDPFHHGVDLGNPCNAPIYAAHSGTVIMAGPYGTLGNYIRIQNDGGTYQTGYAHIINGGTYVRVGDHVDVGQNIARVGMTGGIATGCHLHYEVYQNGSTIDPVPFMRGQGVELAN